MKKPSRSRDVFVIARRAVEVTLGLICAAFFVLFGGESVVGVYVVIAGPVEWPAVVVIPVFVLIAWFCAVIGWRLITGRERPGGGLLPPRVIYVAEAIAMSAENWQKQRYGTAEGRDWREAAAELRALFGSRKVSRKTVRPRRSPGETPGSQ